jgi:hypothetical protein
MPRIAIYGPNLATGGASFHVHAVGCADTRKRLYRGHAPMTFDPDDIPGSANETTRQTIVEEVYSDQIAEQMGDDLTAYMDDFKFFPCIDA